TKREKNHSHVLIIWSTTPFGRDPGDVAVWILDVAGFAMDAVLRVDHEGWITALLHPFIDTRRTVALRGAGIDVVLGRLLQRHLGDLQMNGLVVLMVGI